MKIAAIVVMFVLAIVVVPAGAQNYEHPRSCLSVQNHSSETVVITLNYPTGYNWQWTFAPGEGPKVLSYQGDVVKSPNGNWDVHRSAGSSANFTYDPDRNSGLGCNGTWIETIN